VNVSKPASYNCASRVRHASSQLAVAVQAGPRRGEVQLAVAVRGEKRIRTQAANSANPIPVVQGLQSSYSSGIQEKPPVSTSGPRLRTGTFGSRGTLPECPEAGHKVVLVDST
jgi:hypothetical protein